MAGEEIGGIDSQSLAESVAAAVVANPPEPTETPPEDLSPQFTTEPPVEETVVAPDDQTTVQPTTPEVPAVPQEPIQPVVPDLDEMTLELARLGIDLGVTRSDLPEAVQPMYDQFAQQALAQAHQMQAQQSQLQESQAEIQQFAQKLQDDPQKVLLTMAVTNPEAFQETVEAYQRMGEDDFYRDTVIKDLQAEAKLAASQRQSHIFQQQAMQQKVAQLTRATRLAADQYGVDHGMAEELVAAAITRGGGDMDISQVATVVSRLAPAQRTITPQEKAIRTAQAPTTAVQGTGQPVGAAETSDLELSPGLTRPNRNPFLDLVRGAAGRLRSSE